MQHHTPRALRRAAGAGLLFFVAACGGGDQAASRSTADPDEVDQSTPIAATEQEQSAFNAPADSLITEAQVNAYLRATLTQFDLIRSEAPALHQRIARMEERGKNDNVASGLRNMTEAAGLISEMGELVGGSYVRSSRALGYNPAEMEWVRERMNEITGYMMLRPMYQSAIESAQQLRQQAEQYRGQEGFAEEQINEMIRNADQMEREARQNMAEQSGAAARNLEVLRRARPNVTDHMWAVVAFAGGGTGLFALSGLGDPADTTAQRQLSEWRQVYADALNNRVTPGMEADKAWGEARPQLSAPPANN